MKRLISIFSTLFILTSMVFASDPWLYGQVKDSSYTISQNGNIVTESVTANNGAKISLSANMNKSNINYSLAITGSNDLSFVNSSNFISVYSGNYDSDLWNYVDYKIDSSSTVNNNQANVPSSNQSNNDNDALETAAEVCIVGATACLCSIALISFCDNFDIGDSDPTYHHHHHHHGPDIYIDPFIDSPSKNDSYQSNNQLYNYSGNSGDYLCSFHTAVIGGPDYKIKISTGTQDFYFYFLRSDRKSKSSSSSSSTNPFKNSKKDHHSIVATVTVPTLNRFGGMYIYGGSTVGCYLGCEVQNGFDEDFADIVGTMKDGDWNTLELTPMNSKTYNRFTEDGVSYNDAVNLNIGLTFKLNDYLWMLGGLKLGMNNTYYSGKIETSDDNLTYNTDSYGYVEDANITLVPQLGLNAILGYLNVGCLVNYWPTQGVSCDVLFGIAF